MINMIKAVAMGTIVRIVQCDEAIKYTRLIELFSQKCSII